MVDQKILNKINKTADYKVAMVKQRKLQKNGDDEWYTPMKDIQKELIHWTDKFKGKRIICPCDWLTTFSDAQDALDETTLEKTNISFEEYKENYDILENFNMKDGAPVYKMNLNVLPDDYYGWALGSIATLDKISWKEFEFYTNHASSNVYAREGVYCPWVDVPGVHHDMYTTKSGEKKNLFAGFVYRRKKS